ncbi:MAG: biopolymer transporter ExbD [Bryobacteraceae bacterium]|jgi:biopolymer transport protein ExbD
MAFSMGGNAGFGRSRFRGMNALAEMNIVPLVDVVMVLLVIFMLTAHVMEFGMEVDVPAVNQSRTSAQELPVVTVTKSGALYLNDKEIKLLELGDAVKQRFGAVTGVYVRADKDAIWDVIAQVVSTLNEAHIKNINMVTQPVDEAEKGAGRR